ncbi:MAG TPA: hypothetical protein ENJ57_04090 [Rhizobiales bacterium]|nr:hypothetical protein [Hyphomicrobiales bacterium]
MILGRYILQPVIFSILASQETEADGEIQLTDAILKLMEKESFHGIRFEGRTFDCGNHLGFLTANIALALDRETLGPRLRREIETLLNRPD